MVFNNRTYDSYKNLNKKFINRTVISAITLLLLVSGIYSAVALLNNAAAAGTQTISGNTSAGENLPGWMFNRDLSTTSPYVFQAGNASIGTGSLYAQPISNSSASNKFIAEHFMVTPISDVNSISFDYKLGAGQPVNNGQHFYMNVYTNFAASDDLKFYDCRYNVIGTVGSTSSFTTLTFDPTQAINVTQRNTSPHTCPAVPNDMDTIGGPGSNIRAYSLSMGDTTLSDTGVDGYFDNVVVNRDSDGVTVYDFEPTPPAAPTLIFPANNSKVNASSPIANDWSDVAGADHYVYQSYNVDGSGNCNFSDIRFTGDYVASQTNSRVIADGLTFCWRVKTVGTNGAESAWSELWKVTIDNSTPSVPTMVYNEEPSGDPVANGGLTNSQNFVFNLSSASDTTRYQLKYWNDIPGSPFKVGTPWNPSDLAGYSSALGVYHDNFTQGPGVHYFSFSACDGAGNCSAYGAPFVVTFDSVAPGVPVNGQPHNTYLDTNSFNFTWDPVSDTQIYEFQASLSPSQSGGVLNSGVWNNIANGNSSQNNLTSPMIPSVGAPDGTWYWQVRAIDAAGNTGAWSEIWNVTLDTVDPSVPVHVSPSDGHVTTTANQNLIDWDDSTDATPVTYIYQSSLSSAVNLDGSFVAPAYTSGALSASEIPTPGTPEGTYYWHVKAVDSAGNQSAWSAPWTIVVDNTAPVVTLDAIPDSDDTTPTLTGTVDDPAAVITVSINGGAAQSVTNNGDGTWTYTVDPALTTGDYTVEVAATDSAGNGTTPAPTDDFTVTEPVVVVTQTQGGDGAGGGTDTGTGGEGDGGAAAPVALFAFLGGGAGAGDGDGGDGDGDGQAVQGEADDANDGNGNVRATDNAGVAAVTTDDGGWKFNWWWLLILAALAAAFYGWYRYRQAQADKTL